MQNGHNNMDQETCIQKYLRSGKLLSDLRKEPYCLKIVNHKKFPHLHMFKYNQISSNFRNKIVRESRGIILDANDNWKVVSYPYDKFFNHKESNAAEIDWNTKRVFQKLDGSLMVLYYYNGEWHVSSSGVPDASGPVGIGSTFAELFWKTWNDHCKYELPHDTTKCFMFEMMTPMNQVIVSHDTHKLVLHGVRCLETLEEYDPYFYANKYGWIPVKELQLNDMDAVINTVKSMDPREEEGFVICDGNFNRVKIKSPLYIAASHQVNNANPLSLTKIIQLNEGDEFLSAYPHIGDEYNKMKEKYNQIVDEINDKWGNLKHLGGNQKEYAENVKNFWYKDCMFKLRMGKVKDSREWLANYDPKKLLEYLK